MAKNQQEKIITKKHLARKQREELQTRYIIIASTAIIILIVVLITYGLVKQYVLEPAKPVAQVYGEKISVKEFQENVRYRRMQIIQNYNNMAQYFGDNTQMQEQLQQTLGDVTGIGQSVLDGMIEDIIIRQEAERRGITVSEAELEKSVQENMFGYYPDGTPTLEPTSEPQATSTLSALQQTLTAPTATEVPTMTLPTATSTATLAPTATVSPNITPTITATPYTIDAYQETYQQALNFYKDEVDVSEDTWRRMEESAMYSEKVMEAVLDEMDIKTEEEQVWARQILVSDIMTATMLLEEINNGADFALLAEEYSEDSISSYNGGDMGWFGLDETTIPTEVLTTAWSLQIGEVISQPLQSQSGYHIIQVLGHEVRPLSTNQYEQLRQEKFQEWLDEQRRTAQDTGELIINDIWLEIVPSEPSVQ